MKQKYTPFTVEDAEKFAKKGETVVGKGMVKTEGFDKTVAFMMSLMGQLYEVAQTHERFRMELFYDAEALNTNYCFFAPIDKGESDGRKQEYPVH